MKVVLFHHLQKGNAPEVARKVCLALHRNGMEVWADPRCLGLLKDMDFVCYAPFLEAIQDADVAVAIGGDGTILHCARHVVGTIAGDDTIFVLLRTETQAKEFAGSFARLMETGGF